jgi:ABC-type transporter MlaC component
MWISRITALIALPLTLILSPAAALAQSQAPAAQAAAPSPSQVKAAVKDALMSVGLTGKEKREIRSLVRNYESQTANADDATKKQAQESLLKNIYNSLTPTQQTQFKASIKKSLQTDIQ